MKSLVLVFVVVSFLSTFSAQARPPKKVSPKVASSGIVEQAYEKTKQEYADILASAEAIVTEIDKGSDEWKPIDPNLVEELQKQIKEYNHTSFDVMTARRVEATKAIKEALAKSTEFKSVSEENLEAMTRSIIQQSRGSRGTIVNQKHLLYHFTVDERHQQGAGRVQAGVTDDRK